MSGGYYVMLLPCTVCGDDTEIICSDCRIDGVRSAQARVCAKSECRNRHEAEACTAGRGADARSTHVETVLSAIVDADVVRVATDPEIAAVLSGKRRSAVVAGDCRDVMRAMPPNSISSVVTDAPYGLSKEPDVSEVLQHWLAGDVYEHGSKGFMGRSWDSFVPGPDYWREAFRVLKPGGHLLAMASTRTWDLLSMAIRIAGFENRDTIRVDGPPALGWKHSQGFPKSSGHLKPSWEAILLFRKPPEGSITANALAYGTSSLNVDSCRVKFAGPEDEREAKEKNQHVSHGNTKRVNRHGVFAEDGGLREDWNPGGRLPPNSLLVHHPRCEHVGTKRVRTATAYEPTGERRQHVSGAPKVSLGREFGYADEDGLETVDDWRCVDGCPSAVLDAQSGSSISRASVPREAASGNGWGMRHTGSEYSDDGGASRFVPQFAAVNDPDPFLYEAKAPAGEKFFYCGICRDAYPVSQEARHGHERQDRDHLIRHITQKPLGLMRWILRLCMPKGGVALDPFCGTGTTGVAAAAEGFRFIGVDLDPAHVEISRRRIEADAPLFAFAERRAAESPAKVTDPENPKPPQGAAE